MDIEKMKKTVREIQGKEKLYIILSTCTSLAYVNCDKDTFEDEIFVFYKEEDAERVKKDLEDQGNPVKVKELTKIQILPFFISLITMGVTGVLFHKGNGETQFIPLNRIVKVPDTPRINEEIRKELAGNPNMEIRVENPEFQLTAIYYLQKMRGINKWQDTEETKELHEEMLVHYREGYYIAVRREDGKIPLIKVGEKGSLQPIFTDTLEYMKFKQVNPGVNFRTGILTEREIVMNLAKDATGVVVNPLGICMTLQINKKDS